MKIYFRGGGEGKEKKIKYCQYFYIYFRKMSHVMVNQYAPIGGKFETI